MRDLRAYGWAAVLVALVGSPPLFVDVLLDRANEQHPTPFESGLSNFSYFSVYLFILNF